MLQRAKTQTTSRVVRSLCTMLSLQWEPEIIAVAVMYLAGRLCKFDIQEWTNKQSTRRWWEQFVQDVPVELLEGTQHKDVPLKASSFVFVFFCLHQINMSLPSRHLPPDPGPVLSGKQTHPSADAGEGEGTCYSDLCSSSSTGTTASR